MLKKLSTILLAFMLVASLSFIGCGGGGGGDDDDGDLARVTVFELATDEGIQALELGVITFGDDDGTPSPIAPLVRAGGDDDIRISAVAGPGDQAVSLLLEHISQNWGPGIDLTNTNMRGFRAGDEITITGEVSSFVSGTSVQINVATGDEYAVGNEITSNGPFTINVTLTQAHVTSINTSRPWTAYSARLEIRGPTTGGTNVRVDNIRVVGYRPVTIVALPPPALTVDGTVVSWTAIANASGFRVYVDGDEEETLGPAATSWDAAEELDPGTYNITVRALGIPGVSTESVLSNAVSVSVLPPPTLQLVSVLEISTGWGQGNIAGAGFTAVQNASANAVIRLFMSNDTDPFEDRSDWGVGRIGCFASGADNGIAFNGPPGTSDAERVGYRDISVAAILLLAHFANDSVNVININMWQYVSLYRAELWDVQ